MCGLGGDDVSRAATFSRHAVTSMLRRLPMPTLTGMRPSPSRSDESQRRIGHRRADHRHDDRDGCQQCADSGLHQSVHDSLRIKHCMLVGSRTTIAYVEGPASGLGSDDRASTWDRDFFRLAGLPAVYGRRSPVILAAPRKNRPTRSFD